MRLFFIAILLCCFSTTSIAQESFFLNSSIGLSPDILVFENEPKGVRSEIFPLVLNLSVSPELAFKKFSTEANFFVGPLSVAYHYKNIYPDAFPDDEDKKITSIVRSIDSRVIKYSLGVSFNLTKIKKAKLSAGIRVGGLNASYNFDTSSAGFAQEVGDSGEILSTHIIGTYGYINKRRFEFFVEPTTRLLWDINDKWSFGFIVSYAQGFQKMFEIPFFRSFTLHETGYSEYEEFKAYSRFSHFTTQVNFRRVIWGRDK